MDADRLEQRRESARRNIARARERAGRARRRALVLPIALFGVLWLAVFAQMATGNDPALGGTTKVAGAEAPSRQGQRSSARDRSASSTAASQPATALAYAPLTGTLVRVPASGASNTTSTLNPSAASVTTSQS